VSSGRSGPAGRPSLGGRSAFLSASIPNSRDWDGEFHPLEITDAVMAAVSAILGADGRISYGGHPAIAPLLLRVARDFGPIRQSGRSPDDRALVTVYQSALYEPFIPEPTWHLQEEGLGHIEIIDAVPGDLPQRPWNERSLTRMRRAMLAREADLAFAIFIGGMSGIREELDEFRLSFPERPVYAFGAPGGVARELAAEFRETQRYYLVNPAGLFELQDYGVLMDDVMADAMARTDS
jgi:hypothetical protein